MVAQKKSRDTLLNEIEELNYKLKSIDSNNKQMHQEKDELRKENLMLQKHLDQVLSDQEKIATCSLNSSRASETPTTTAKETQTGICS